MKKSYKTMIQELMGSTDPCLAAFAASLENRKRLSSREKESKCARLGEPGVIEQLVDDLMPRIVRIAYKHRDNQAELSVMDLITEGIIIAHNALRTYWGNHQKANIINVISKLNNEIERLVGIEKCNVVMCSFDEDDERLYQGMDLWTDYSRRADKEMTKKLQKFYKTGSSMARKKKKKPQTGWALNQFGVMVKKCCLTCPFWDVERTKKSRLCSESEKSMNRYQVCDRWKMNDGLQQAGSGKGVVRDIATKKVVIK